LIRLYEILALIAIIGITSVHAHIFNENRKIGPWFHFLWAAVYFIPCGVIAYLTGSYWLAGAFILERAVFYNPILNLIRQRPFFYKGYGTIHPAITNFLYTPLLWVVYILAFITINIFI